METGLLHDYFGNFSAGGERYYFRMEGSSEVRLKGTSEMEGWEGGD